MIKKKYFLRNPNPLLITIVILSVFITIYFSIDELQLALLVSITFIIVMFIVLVVQHMIPIIKIENTIVRFSKNESKPATTIDLITVRQITFDKKKLKLHFDNYEFDLTFLSPQDQKDFIQNLKEIRQDIKSPI